jgi:hypothetical protein
MAFQPNPANAGIPAENQQNRPAGSQQSNAGNQRQRPGGQNRASPAVMQVNPERAPPLIAKWQKLLGKDLESIEIKYEAESVSVWLYGRVGTPFEKKNDSGETLSLSVPEYKERKSQASQPDDSEKMNAFRDKFELRLNQAFPSEGAPADASEQAIRQFLNGLTLHQRRAMLMSNKQFKAAYPNGFTQA